MEKRNTDLSNLTANDFGVLKQILNSTKIPNSDIAKEMNLSPQEC